MVTLPLFFYQNFHSKCNVYANVVVFFYLFQLIFIFPLFLGMVKYAVIKMNLNKGKTKIKLSK